MNARVQRINLTTNEITIFGRRGLKLGNLSRPKGIAFDSESNVYIIESYFDHLLVFDKNSNFLMPLGGTGYGAGEFYLPSGLWIGPRDRLYIADMMNGRVSVFQFLGGL
jgi:DNA-binding beta-propeller fold protein YncE